MTNLFAYRTAYPKELKNAKYPIGTDNNHWLKEIAGRVNEVVLGWGVSGTYLDRNKQVYEFLEDKAYCIDRTKYGHPKHPLYIKAGTKLVRYEM